MGLAIVVDVLSPIESSGVVQNTAVVVDVLVATTTPTETVGGVAVVDTVSPGNTVANVSWGYTFPLSPDEGQIFIKVTP